MRGREGFGIGLPQLLQELLILRLATLQLAVVHVLVIPADVVESIRRVPGNFLAWMLCWNLMEHVRVLVSVSGVRFPSEQRQQMDGLVESVLVLQEHAGVDKVKRRLLRLDIEKRTGLKALTPNQVYFKRPPGYGAD